MIQLIQEKLEYIKIHSFFFKIPVIDLLTKDKVYF
jgi:hypothetical protein